MKFDRLLIVVVLLARTLSHAGPTLADAAVAERIHTLSVQIEQSPANQALRLQRTLAYLENNQRDFALADIRVAEAVGDPVEAAFTHGVVLYQTGDYVSARILL